MSTQKESAQKQEIGSLLTGSIPANADTMDAMRATSTLRDFLLKLDQARDWVSTITGVQLDIAQFKEELPKAEILARVAVAVDPTISQRIHTAGQREYRHIDNIMLFLNWCKKIKLRKHFYFETVDLYESKNIPKVIYCIHGLAGFLNRRGTGRGIVVRDVDFTSQEKSLFTGELRNIAMQRYDDINDRLDSEEDLIIDNGIVNFAETLVWKCSLRALHTGRAVTAPVLRKFIDFNFSNEKAYKKISDQQAEILHKLKKNNLKEVEKDSLIHTIRLIHENINNLRGVPTVDCPQASDYTVFKRILFRLIHDYALCFNIVHGGSELPLRTLFPDNVIGDFHFSKFIIKNRGRDDQLLVRLARDHFVSSRAFRAIVDAFESGNCDSLNPIAVQEQLRARDRRALLDEAINDEAVRNEILKRAQAIVDFTDAKIQFLTNIELPYYTRLFADHPQFYELFIEPAVFSSGNYIIADLMGFIFTGSTPGQERIYKSDTGFVQTDNINFSDYAPLKNFLERSRVLFSTLFASHAPATDVNEYFMGQEVQSLLQVEITVEEISNIIMVLKRNMDLMGDEMTQLIRNLSQPANSRVEVHSDLSTAKIDVPVQVNGIVQPMAPSPQTHKYREVAVTEGGCVKNLSGGEKFTLRLDSQFSSELDERGSLDAPLMDLKCRMTVLIAISSQPTIEKILNCTSADEAVAFSTVQFVDTDLASFKRAVRADIKAMQARGVLKCPEDLLSMIASDILVCKYRLLNREISLNSETSDALFYMSTVLEKSLCSLYAYVNDLTRLSFINKSGLVFNRQASPPSHYGTYLVPLEALHAQVYEEVDLGAMAVRISCDEAMVFELATLVQDRAVGDPVTVRFDSLLKMREAGTQCVDLNEVCCVSVRSLIDLVNDKYINY